MKNKPHIEITDEDANRIVRGQEYLKNKTRLIALGMSDDEASRTSESMIKYGLTEIHSCDRGAINDKT